MYDIRMTSISTPSGRDKRLPSGPPSSYAEDMEARVAVLEQIAKDTKDVLVEIKQDIREIRRDNLDIRHDQRTDFRLLFGALITTAIGLACLMARGFHWF
jgi:hypothetical protein